tara:strand:+ start:1362 stop:1688 length:327 start_codon:yes stop_codon:yes gene_type:complete
VNEKPKTARSYRTNVIDDNLVLSFNFKFLVNILLIGGTILYGWFSLQERIKTLEDDLINANTDIRNLLAKHELEERTEREQLAEKVAFYEKELQINLNPMSWGKRKKK